MFWKQLTGIYSSIKTPADILRKFINGLQGVVSAEIFSQVHLQANGNRIFCERHRRIAN